MPMCKVQCGAMLMVHRSSKWNKQGKSVEREKGQKNEMKRKERMKSIKCKESFQVINLQGGEKVEK